MTSKLSLRDICVFWVPKGLQPLTSYSVRKTHETIESAINDALDETNSKENPESMPWIRAGSGVGAAAFDKQGIEILKLIYNTGAKTGKPI